MMSVQAFLQNLFDPKNFTFAAVFGFTSFVIALTSLIISIRNRTKDSLRDLTGEYYDVVKEVSDLSSKRENLAKELDTEVGSPVYLRQIGIMNDRADLLLSRADVLLKMPIKPSDVSLKIIGGMLMEMGKAAEAAVKHKAALNISSSPLKAAINRRSYGRSLILSGNLTEGRNEMLKAAKDFETLGDDAAYDQITLYYRSVEVRQSLVETQLRIRRADFFAIDFKSFETAVCNVGDRSRRTALDHTLVDIRGRARAIFNGIDI